MAGFKTAFRYGGTVNYRWPNAGTAAGKAGKAAKLPAPDSCSPPVARKASSSSDHDDETLRRWRDSFLAARGQVLQLGFDERFIRIWEFYLAYCEAAFAMANIDVVQYTLQKR